MNIIYLCHCGCETRVWRDGPEIWIDSAVILAEGQAQQVKFIDAVGFVNSLWSILPEGERLVRQELEFPQA